MKRWPLVLAIALVGLGIGGGLAYRNGVVALAYPPPSYPLGIDLSHHQGELDWSGLDRSKVAFVYLKASEGGDLRDRAFLANAAGAARSGIPAGAYHYFTMCRRGAEQAANFLAASAGARMRLRPAIDLEYVGNCAARPNRAAFAAELRAFLNALGTAGGKPILYSTRKFYADYLNQPPFTTYPLWLRDTIGPLSPPPSAHVLVWQYADNGRLRGISGPVDRNVLMGQLADLEAPGGPHQP